jgi:hypothetical protein
MAKIFISYPEELKPLADVISDTLRKNSGHRPALFQEQADFTLQLSQDWAGGDKHPTLFVFSNDERLKDIGKSIASTFREENIFANFPIFLREHKDYPTLGFNAGRRNQPFDENIWGTLVAKAIIKYFNPEYIEISGKKEKEPLVKRSQDKTYYDRTFNNNATKNSSILFKKK